MYSKKIKIIAGVLVFILCMSYVSTITKIGQVLAANSDVEFSVNFGGAKYTTQNNTLTTNIVLSGGGYLEDTRVTVLDPNFTILDASGAKRVAKDGDATVIEYNTISGGTGITFPIKFVPKNKISKTELNKEMEFYLTATHVKNDGTRENIGKTVTVSLAWIVEQAQSALTPEIDMQTTRFIPYQINENKGIIIEQKLTTKLPNNALPVKENEIVVSIPKIEGIAPTNITVNANSLAATNGDTIGENFGEENRTIKLASQLTTEEIKSELSGDSQVIVIDVKNEEDANNKVSWLRGVADEFTITYKYPEAAYAAYMNNPDTSIYTYVNDIVDTYYYAQSHKYSDMAVYDIPTEETGHIVDLTATVSKNKLYVNPGKENTINFTETLNIDLAAPNLTDKIVVTALGDRFDGVDGQILNTYYTNKSTILTAANRDKILSMLDVGGTLSITAIYADGSEETLYGFTKTEEGVSGVTNPPTDGADNKKPVNMKVELTKAIRTGVISIDFEKEGKITPTAENVKLYTEAKIEAMSADTRIVHEFAVKILDLVEPESQAELKIENSTLSTIVDKNQNVKLTAVLKTDTTETKLYKNPVLNIILPSYVEAIDLKDVEVLFDTEASKLTKKSQTVVTNENGTKSIIIELQGEQTEYTLNAVSKGVNVVVTADISLNKSTTSGQDTITMEYTNNNGTPETKTTTVGINVVAPVGIITATTVSNFSSNNTAVTAMNGEEKLAVTDILSPAREATYTMNVINNYEVEIKNVSILGRFPVSGAKDTETGADLGSTFDMSVTNPITVNGVDASKVTVYYSENADASKDLSNTANGWTEEMMVNAKSYLIVLDSSVALNKAGSISFTYNANIPENLQYNQSAYEVYTVYFDNEQDGIVNDKEVATKLGVTTGKGQILEASLVSDKAEDYVVQAGEIITYTLRIRNTGTETARSTKAKLVVPIGLDYVDENGRTVASEGREVELNIGDIAAGEEKEANILLKANLTSTDIATTSLKITVSEEKGISAETETVKNTIRGVDYQVGGYVEKDTNYLKEGDNFKYIITALATGADKTNRNTILEITLPEEVDYKSATVETEKNMQVTDITDSVNVSYNNSSRKVTISLGDVTSSEIKRVKLNVAVGKLADGVYAKEVTPTARITGTGVEEQRVSIDPVEIGKVGFRIVQTSNIPENTTITAGEDFKYVFTIENLSNMDLYNVKITDIVPQGIKFGNITAEGTKGSSASSMTNEVTLSIKGREVITLTATAVADTLDETVKATNKATIAYEGKVVAESNTISHNIKKFDPADYPGYSGGGSGTDDPTYTKRIMGTIWEDANANGARDEGEKLISGVQLMLFNNNKGDLVRDSQGNVVRVLTDETGTYTFAGLGTGSYTVIFLYDVANYSSTTYRKAGVDETLNSDGVDTNITIDGTTRIAAITEAISVSDKNVYSIDLGLVSNPKFDLKLDKVVSKITLQDSEGTTVVEYNDSKLAKKDLVGSQIPNTTIVVEYKLKVTNEGAISGYVKKLADYMPKEMKFSSELNKDWYEADNGTLYNSTLANTLINPGETKEVTLVLTKKMTNDNLGVYHNEAEIYEAYNDLGIADIDSTAGNKKAAEDDISSADVLITVKTGEVAVFIGASIAIIATIAVAAYIIKKKVIR